MFVFVKLCSLKYNDGRSKVSDLLFQCARDLDFGILQNMFTLQDLL